MKQSGFLFTQVQDQVFRKKTVTAEQGAPPPGFVADRSADLYGCIVKAGWQGGAGQTGEDSVFLVQRHLFQKRRKRQ